MAVTASVATSIGQRSACAIRVTRLDATCAPMEGDNNMVTTAGLVTLTATPDVEEGTKFEPKTACGDVGFTAEDPDIIKRWTLEGEFLYWDLALGEILTDATVLLGATGGDWAAKVAGLQMPGSGSTHGNGVALEIWTKTASGTGSCGEVSENPPYMRHIFPHCFFRPGPRTFENDVATMQFSGTSNANPSWGEGPYDDWLMEDPVDAYTGYAYMYDAALPTISGGYDSVPAAP